MATKPAICRKDSNCDCELGPSPAPEGAEVVELAFATFDHTFAHWAHTLLNKLVLSPSDRKFRKAHMIDDPRERREKLHELWGDVRTARQRRLEVSRVVERVLNSVKQHADFRLDVDERDDSYQRLLRCKRAIELVEHHGDFESMYPDRETWLAVVVLVETEVFTLFLEVHGNFPLAGSSEQIELERIASLASQVCAAFVTSEEAIRLLNQ